MSIEEKAKAYDALKDIISKTSTDKYGCIIGIKPFDLFPELKESEDEKVIKYIINFINLNKGTNLSPEDADRMLSWVEKHGEEKDYYTKQQLRDMGFAFTLNGDIVTPEKTNEAIKEYIANEKKKWEKEQKPVEWKQENVEELTDFENAMMHIGISFFGGNSGLNPNNTDVVREQANLLSELVPKQEWSEEDKAMIGTIISDLERHGGCGEHCSYQKEVDWLKILKDRVFPQPQEEWSDEDEAMLQTIINRLELSKNRNASETPYVEICVNWIKSLKDRVQSQPKQEWSEEDIVHINSIINDLEQGAIPEDDDINWLKRLRPHTEEDLEIARREGYKQGKKDGLKEAWETAEEVSWKPSEQEKIALRTAIHVMTVERNFPKTGAYLQNILNVFDGQSRKEWKPSEEQINALEVVSSGKGFYDKYVLKELLEQLKKL